jgi:hypothetical protein
MMFFFVSKKKYKDLQFRFGQLSQRNSTLEFEIQYCKDSYQLRGEILKIYKEKFGEIDNKEMLKKLEKLRG